ncbi:DUF2065 domain-containing protein [Colwellia sp. MB3u-55]|jgi:uncharacterized protein YjeT (DUF2065 family)|uniref:DUF2065 domain-containing protein n=1 Tax=Colwellia sp. MB3u-55 TaxID=2759810 RepID=UPI0015F50DB9|nr:DUF2065 domain-containing protein [Colwellia sp. MB3u-55]MBA6252526.1 DUF2065 domain-containing protein [Colwellia sp. MB3u-55]
MLETLLTAFALVLIIEGLIPALFPNKWRDTMEKLAQQSSLSIRNIGISLLVVGTFILWLLSY